MYADEHAGQYPEAIVDPRGLYVDDGNLITSAGTAAGIDACLHLVRRELGTAIATKIARRMVVPPQRDGGQQQFVEMPIPACSSRQPGPGADLGAGAPGRAAHRLVAGPAGDDERPDLRPAVRAETGTTPHKWLTQQRILAARSLLEESDLAVEQIATRVGFNSAVVMREHFRREIGLAPVDYRRRFVPPRDAGSCRRRVGAKRLTVRADRRRSVDGPGGSPSPRGGWVRRRGSASMRQASCFGSAARAASMRALAPSSHC